MSQIFISRSEEETREIGRQVGAALTPGTVIALTGTLGAGKTRFVQGLGLGLGIPLDTIVSPTFTLCVPYQGRLQLLHLDAYRIVNPSEIDELGLDEAVEDGAVLVVEWFERFAKFFPAPTIQISIDLIEDDQRKITVRTETPGALAS